MYQYLFIYNITNVLVCILIAGSMNSLSSSGSKLSQNESLKSLKDKVNNRLRSQSSEKIIDVSGTYLFTHLLTYSLTLLLIYTGINALVAAGVISNASIEETPKLTPVKATGKIQQLRNDVMNANPTDGTYFLSCVLTYMLTHSLIFTHSKVKNQSS